MTGTHLDDGVLRAYAEDRLADVDAWSVETHLDRCPLCRGRLPLDETTGRIVAEVGAALRDRLTVADPLPRPSASKPAGVPTPAPAGWARPGSAGRSRRGRVRPGTRWRRSAVLLGAGPAARAGWLGSVAVTLALVAAVAANIAPVKAWVLLLVAPVLPVLGVASSYGRHTDPLHDLVASTPYAGLRIVLWRTLSVLAVAIPMSLVAGAVSGIGVPGLWLLPSLALTVLTLGLGAVVEPYRAGIGVAVGWAVLVLAPVGGDRLVAPVAVPGWLAVVAVAVLVAGARTARDRMRGEVTG
ncbi:anti-sigma factor [Micromonospora sp. HM5-17]|uniref:anti-sigma factor n=1 Tax=Micromonospora sp. HM5-17 TaxID=2487710 RepID=UPI000F494F03|nr:anti-sigma factor [Micromonospora sp. HM5-17]ROT31244.1 anti-sigma factor [Micromonospora sp. HM5-17]